MIGTIILVVYLLGIIPVWRKAAWVIADGAYDTPDGIELFVGIFFGLYVAAVWPIVVPFYVLYRRDMLTKGSFSFLSPPKHVKREQELRQREREIADKDFRIRSLERELGIKTDA